MVTRVPTQISFSNSLCFSRFFPVRPQIFPVPIYMFCDYYLHKTNLTDLSGINFLGGDFLLQILKYLLPLESGNLQLEQTKFPVFWQIFQIPCVFPDRDFFSAIFAVFPLQNIFPRLFHDHFLIFHDHLSSRFRIWDVLRKTSEDADFQDRCVIL